MPLECLVHEDPEVLLVPGRRLRCLGRSEDHEGRAAELVDSPLVEPRAVIALWNRLEWVRRDHHS